MSRRDASSALPPDRSRLAGLQRAEARPRPENGEGRREGGCTVPSGPGGGGQTAITLNHEINNPLTVILATAEMALLADSCDASLRERFRQIVDSAMRIADTARRLREMERVELSEYIGGGPLMLDLGPRQPVVDVAQ